MAAREDHAEKERVHRGCEEKLGTAASRSVHGSNPTPVDTTHAKTLAGALSPIGLESEGQTPEGKGKNHSLWKGVGHENQNRNAHLESIQS